MYRLQNSSKETDLKEDCVWFQNTQGNILTETSLNIFLKLLNIFCALNIFRRRNEISTRTKICV